MQFIDYFVFVASITSYCRANWVKNANIINTSIEQLLGE